MINWRKIFGINPRLEKNTWQIIMIGPERIEYWLGYAEDSYGSHRLNEWLTDGDDAFTLAVRDWMRNSDFKKDDREHIKSNEPQIREMIDKFIQHHGKITGNIVQAFISQL